jgi:RND family efflux transporter MFP subunit
MTLPESPASDLQTATEISNETTNLVARSKKPWIWVTTALAVTTSGVILWRMVLPQTNGAQSANAQSQGPPPRAVELTTLTPGNGVRQVQLIGQVEATEQATIRAQTSGVLREIRVQAGDRVLQNQVIARLDDADQQLALAEAQGQLAEAQGQLDRLEVGTRSEVISQRQAELRAAAAREQEARERLNGLIALQPKRIAQRQSELASAQAQERQALDNLQRTQPLAAEGAQSQRLLVEAESAADQARSERAGAEAALTETDVDSRQQIAVAKTALENAMSERSQIAATLAEAKAGPTREELETQRARTRTAQAAVNQAKLALQRTQIRTTSDGVVQTRQVSPGDYVQANGAILTMIAGDRLDLFLELPEDLTGQVTPGLAIELTARALPNWQSRTTITAVVPTADAASRRQRVRVQLNNPPPELLPGMAIDGQLALPSNQPSFVISRDALTQHQNQWLVFTVEQNQAKAIEVQKVADMGAKVAISNPQLQTGQSVVLVGGDGLRDGAPVKVIKPNANR